MLRWQGASRGRRRVVLALAALAHVALVGVMWCARLEAERPDPGRVVEATIWLARPPVARATPTRPRVTRVTRLPAPARVAPDAQAIQLPPPEPQAIAQAASAAQPPASAASRPLDLTLSREQLRAIVAGSKATLAQQLAAPAKPSALARLGGDEAPYEEVQLAGGVTEVHVHGGCFRLVPTPRAQYDPFNHANERLMAACH